MMVFTTTLKPNAPQMLTRSITTADESTAVAPHGNAGSFASLYSVTTGQGENMPRVAFTSIPGTATVAVSTTEAPSAPTAAAVALCHTPSAVCSSNHAHSACGTCCSTGQ
jgi:hypothetical protein